MHGKVRLVFSGEHLVCHQIQDLRKFGGVILTNGEDDGFANLAADRIAVRMFQKCFAEKLVGGIGKEVIKIGISLGMKVKVLTRSPKTEKITLNFFDGQKVDFEITSTNDWDEFLKDTEFLSINTPKSKEYIFYKILIHL